MTTTAKTVYVRLLRREYDCSRCSVVHAYHELAFDGCGGFATGAHRWVYEEVEAMSGNDNETVRDCRRCGEDAYCVSDSGLHMARVRRASKCKDYHAGRLGQTCKTTLCDSKSAAVSEWNRTYGTEVRDERTDG